MSHPRVLVIYNEPVLPADHPDALSETDVLEATSWVVGILEQAGFPTRRLGFSYDPAPLLRELREQPADVVFNMFEGLANQTGTEISVAALLEWLNVPFTGSPSLALALGRDKVRTKLLLQAAGVPTADFQVIETPPAPRWPYEWPAIVKPACQDCSVGIDQGSVVTNQKELGERVALVLERYGPPVMVEQFVFGRELHANIVEEPGESPLAPELVSVPFAELRFTYEPGHRFWPIYSYDAKWKTESEEFKGTPLSTVVTLSPALTARVRRVAERAYNLVGLRDCGRIDLRLTEDGQPYVLEVNPNPYLHSEALIDGLKAIGRSHPQFIANMVWNALARGAKVAPPVLGLQETVAPRG
jgi:D-alanine-D-alanine ligase